MDRVYRFAWAGLTALFLSLICISAKASVWISSDNISLRHNVRILADAGLLKTPVMSWPLPWAAIADDINRLNEEREKLPAKFRQAVSQLYRAYKNDSMDGFKLKTKVSLSNDQANFTRFGHSQQEEAEFELGLGYLDQDIAFEINSSVVSDPIDGKEYRFDNSYLATSYGNWILSVNTLEKWWGAGYSDSIMLSNNARPMPVMQLSRMQMMPFESEWLDWLGYWNFTTFMGQLETNRAIPAALLWGARLEIKPSDYLEIAVSRAAQWGGEGRPQNLSVFWDLLIGHDNCGSDGIDECSDDQVNSNEPGNQLASVEARVSLAKADIPVAMYAQVVGEDEASSLPSRLIGFFGFESWWYGEDSSYRIFAEHYDTATEALYETSSFNTAYEHGLYQTGYRYLGRAIGSTFDNDSRINALGLMADFDNQTSFLIQYREGKINRDGADPSGYHSVSSAGEELKQLQFNYRFESDFGALDLNLEHTKLEALFPQNNQNNASNDKQWGMSLNWSKQW